jgi:hypothetical protein
MNTLIILGANPNHMREHIYLDSQFKKVLSFGNVRIPYLDNHYEISVNNILEIIKKIELAELQSFEIFSRFTGEKLFVRYIIEVYFNMHRTSYHIYKSAADKSYMRLFFEKLNIPTTSLSSQLTGSIVKPAISIIGKVGVKKLKNRDQFKSKYHEIIETGANLDLNFEQVASGKDFTLFLKFFECKVSRWKIIEEEHTFSDGNLNTGKLKVMNDPSIWHKVEQYALALAPYCNNHDVITLHFKYQESLGATFYELGYGLGGDQFFDDPDIFQEWQEWLKC